MSANSLSIALRVLSSRIDQIINEKRSLSPDTALRLAKYFGGDAQSWLNLQTTYDLKRTESKFGSLIDSEVQPMANKLIYNFDIVFIKDNDWLFASHSIFFIYIVEVFHA